jgi:hypothetical protein
VYLASTYNECSFSRTNVFDNQERKPQIVVFQRIERGKIPQMECKELVEENA